ncbi:MAG TPA: aldo/keto reductase [Kofleriaceae bacterium]|nr:aldo/keto reductase [Kofleriaceae bacterium]
MIDRVEPTAQVRGITVPRFFYGTAWKEDATEALAYAALGAGFRAIDTANQRKHYYEEGVGRAITRRLGEGLPRDALFVQSKFTYRDGQDHRLPYDPGAPIAQQVRQSFDSSLAHLGVARLDSLVLHGPSRRDGLGPEDREAWQAMEALVDVGGAQLIGISNATAAQIEALVGLARIPPAFVQNRCYAERGWDAAVRAVCERHGIMYQGFSLLTANRQVLAHAGVRELAERHGKTTAQIVFRFALQLGMFPLTGTSDPAHMAQDLAAFDFELSRAELSILESAGRR